MSAALSVATICFIACHNGSAEPFAAFAKGLSKNGWAFEVYTSDLVRQKFENHQIAVKRSFPIGRMSLEEEFLCAEEILKTSATASVILIDIGHRFATTFQETLARLAPQIACVPYYDNPEPYVSEYSELAAKAMRAARRIFVANCHLAQSSLFEAPGQEIDFEERQRVGIGYYPIDQADRIAERRATERISMRQKVFAANDLIDTGQKVLVYFGSNHKEYFSKAFPAFLRLLEEGMEEADFSNLVIVIQQHPGAKNGENSDGVLASAWRDNHRETPKAPTMILSDFPSDVAQIIADGALYYQTSMASQFVLAAIPTAQVGPPFEDVLVRNQLCFAAETVDQFIPVIHDLIHQEKQMPQERVLAGLGSSPDWLPTLDQALREIVDQEFKSDF